MLFCVVENEKKVETIKSQNKMLMVFIFRINPLQTNGIFHKVAHNKGMMVTGPLYILRGHALYNSQTRFILVLANSVDPVCQSSR